MARRVVHRYSLVLIYKFVIFGVVRLQTSSISGDVTTAPGNVTCAGDELLCNNGVNCYKASYKCDGLPDCPDNSDETNCTALPVLPCPEGLTRCPDQRCVKSPEFCNPVNGSSSSVFSDTLSPTSTINTVSLHPSDGTVSSELFTTYSSVTPQLTDILSSAEMTSYTSTMLQSSFSSTTPKLPDLISPFSLSADDSRLITKTTASTIWNSPGASEMDTTMSNVLDSSLFFPSSRTTSINTVPPEMSSLYLNVTSLGSIDYTSSVVMTTSSMTEMNSSTYVQTTQSTDILPSVNVTVTSIESVQLTPTYVTSTESVPHTSAVEMISPTLSEMTSPTLIHPMQSTEIISSWNITVTSVESSQGLIIPLNTTMTSHDFTSSVFPYISNVTEFQSVISTVSSMLFTTSNYSGEIMMSSEIFPQNSSVIQSVFSMMTDSTSFMTSDSIKPDLSSFHLETSFDLSTSQHILPTSLLDSSSVMTHQSVEIEPTTSSETVPSSSIISSTPITSPANTSSTIAPPTEGPLPPWVIAAIVCGSVVFLYLIFLVYVLCKRRHKLTKYKMAYEDPDDIGYRRSIVKKSGNDYVSYDNRLAYEPLDDSEPNGFDTEMNRPYSFGVRNLRDSDFRRTSDDYI